MPLRVPVYELLIPLPSKFPSFSPRKNLEQRVEERLTFEVCWTDVAVTSFFIFYSLSLFVPRVFAFVCLENFSNTNENFYYGYFGVFVEKIDCKLEWKNVECSFRCQSLWKASWDVVDPPTGRS